MSTWFSVRKRPNVYIVYVLDVWYGEHLLLELVEVDSDWGGLHEDSDAVLDDVPGGEHHQDAEHEGAHWVDHLQVRVELYYNRSNQYSERLNQVPDQVDHSRTHVRVVVVSYYRKVFGLFTSVRLIGYIKGYHHGTVYVIILLHFAITVVRVVMLVFTNMLFITLIRIILTLRLLIVFMLMQVRLLHIMLILVFVRTVIIGMCVSVIVRVVGVVMGVLLFSVVFV